MFIIRFGIAPVTLKPSPANDNREPFTPHSMKDLLCDECGVAESTRFGLCEDCIADAEAQTNERRNFHPDAEH